MSEIVHGVEVSRELLERALHPDLRMGAGCLAGALEDVPRPFAILTQPPVLPSIPETVRARAAHLRMVESLDRSDLERVVEELPPLAAVVGVGGGMVMDNAKWVAWKRTIPYYAVPSSVSVDAFVTNTIAVREGSRVVYHGFVAPAAVVIDSQLIATAPPRFNRAGVGDLLSIHTALWDWERGVAHGGRPFLAEIARRSARLLEEVDAHAAAIGRVDPEALVFLARGYADVNTIMLEARHSQPEEGCEHYLAYALEEATGASYVHGEIVGLGSVVMSTVQDNDPGRARSILARCRVDWQPRHLGITREVLVRALTGLPEYVRATKLPWSAANVADLSEAAVDRLLAGPLADLVFLDDAIA